MVRHDLSQFGNVDAEHEGKGGGKLLIMIVEDDAKVGGALERALRCAGHNAVVIPSGMEALSLMHLQMPRLIMLDLGSPGLDGLAVLRAIRKDRAYDGMPVVIYSGEFSETTRRATMLAGAQDFIVKGTVGVESLIQRIEQLMKDQQPRLRMTQ